MSQKAVEQLLGRLMTDGKFRRRALKALDSACMEEGYDLTDAERHIVASMDLAGLASSGEMLLDERIKRFAY